MATAVSRSPKLDSPAGASYAKTLAVGDVDGDGHLDVVTGGDSVATVAVYLSVGGGAFARTDYPAPKPRTLLLSDLDRDGRADVVVLSISNVISVFLTEPGGGLDAHTDYGPYYPYVIPCR